MGQSEKSKLNENLAKAKNKTTGVAGRLKLKQVILGLPSLNTKSTRHANRKNTRITVNGRKRKKEEPNSTLA